MVERDVAALRARVAKLEQIVEQLQRHLGVAFTSRTDGGASGDVLELVRRGEKLQAMRLHVQQTGSDLKAAKDLIDSLE